MLHAWGLRSCQASVQVVDRVSSGSIQCICNAVPRPEHSPHPFCCSTDIAVQSRKRLEDYTCSCTHMCARRADDERHSRPTKGHPSPIETLSLLALARTLAPPRHDMFRNILQNPGALGVRQAALRRGAARLAARPSLPHSALASVLHPSRTHAARRCARVASGGPPHAAIPRQTCCVRASGAQGRLLQRNRHCFTTQESLPVKSRCRPRPCADHRRRKPTTFTGRPGLPRWPRGARSTCTAS